MTTATDSIIPFLVGGALLLFGGRYYWLVAAGVGFLFGANIGSAPDGGVVTGSAIAMGLLFGFIALVASVLVTKFALAATGFIVGGVFFVQFLTAIEWSLCSNFAAFLVGGIFGMIFVLLAQDWALIFLSVITGAGIIVNALDLDPESANFVYVVLVIVGFVVQLFLKRRG